MLGVCYYPEHWPRSRWREDAEAMVSLGLEVVRVGEFCWSRLEPRAGEYCFDWLDSAVETLCQAGLQVVMGTPTAAPPKWLVERWPEVLPVDPQSGCQRGFGSRRHYDFSSQVYVREALRISTAMARRYGQHPAVIGWQIDNELCCHDTALSGSDVAQRAFQDWCRDRYTDIDALNDAWGNVFWSMEYGDFSDIELPLRAVTETSPAHQLAYRRFSSDQVVRFHNRMVAVLRREAPGKFITTNFIPMFETGVDNFALAAELDFASYDSYPLGQTGRQFAAAPADTVRRHMRTGHPDLAAYYHDQTRDLTRRGYWVMEQQPGPVNWAENNPRPAPGMVRFWTLEAFAHGADCVCYFRWRQAPFAQEQMHAGLLRVDNSRTEAWPQIEQLKAELDYLKLAGRDMPRSRVAIVTSTESLWVSDIERQGGGYEFNRVQFSWYSALRALGVNVDFVTPQDELGKYALVLVPGLPVMKAAFIERCAKSSASFIFGPRTGAKTDEFGVPETLPPGPLQRLINIRVLAVETLREDCPESIRRNGRSYASIGWREQLDPGTAEVLARYADASPALVRQGRFSYLATLTDAAFLRDFFLEACADAGIETFCWGEDLRVCRRGELHFAFNYSPRAQLLPLPAGTPLLLGDRLLQPRDVAVWKT